ncbi:glycosyltransferase [Prevotella sp. P4-119]|uniref:glycosyltransferase n=1 Tax=Prevotella sp. P4-119 TaxID=2024218 RepID=UPI0021125197|nr:glycosyltransferase [Prevotella sp. P4-119]
MKYFLMVSADRDSKNAIKAIRAFYQYSKKDKDMYFLIIGYPRDVKGKIIKLDFLSDSDLSVAMENCYALLYPSYFEGFGYPPLEAMKYGRPVLCSNSTSMPEILGDAPIYFSPLYESAIFKAMCDLSLDNYESRVLKSIVQYKKVS